MNASIPNESTPILSGLDTISKSNVEEEDYDDDDVESNTNYIDDHYSPMTAEQYLENRVKAKLQEKIVEVTRMVERNERISSVITLITVFSGATAALSLQWFVPVVLGISAAFTTGQQFRKYPQRIESGNNMIVQLNELKLWWMSLSMYQRQLPASKDKLIGDSEGILLREMMASYGGGTSH